MSKQDEPMVTIACAGCGRTQTLRASKLFRCDYYACSDPCKANPAWRHPPLPVGHVRVTTLAAAGAFNGYTVRRMTREDVLSVGRAKRLRDAGKQQS
ncbi:MAG: hypothetical protein ACJ8CB_21680 [Ktedonobacteraceae bacterium]|jgi:hypothetical protein